MTANYHEALRKMRMDLGVSSEKRFFETFRNMVEDHGGKVLTMPEGLTKAHKMAEHVQVAWFRNGTDDNMIMALYLPGSGSGWTVGDTEEQDWTRGISALCDAVLRANERVIQAA